MISRRVFICICLLFFSTYHVAHAATIHVQWGETLPLTTQKQAQSKAIQDLVYNEAVQFIGTQIPAKRAIALQNYFAKQARGLTNSVTELETTPYPDGTNNTIFAIEINKGAIHQILRELGIIYIHQASIPYTLHIKKQENTPDTSSIQQLEIITGLVQKSQSDLQLYLSYEGTLWQASIIQEQATDDTLQEASGTAEQDSIKAEAPTLDSIWRNIWGTYLARQHQLAAQSAQSYILRIWGMQNTNTVENLHKTLKNWEAAVQNPILATIDMQHGYAAATWQVSVMNESDLTQRLQKHTMQNGLTFSLKKELIIEKEPIPVPTSTEGATLPDSTPNPTPAITEGTTSPSVPQTNSPASTTP